MLSTELVTAAYIGSSVLFILSLGGLSNQEKAKRGVWFGIVGMAVAILATVLGLIQLPKWLQPYPQYQTKHLFWLFLGCLAHPERG